MRITELRDLVTTVEQIRAEMHPDLAPAFLEAVVRAEEQNPEDDSAALRDIQAALALLPEPSKEA